MEVNTINIPEFALNDTYRPQLRAKFERVHKFHPQGTTTSNDINTEIRLHPNLQFPRKFSGRPVTVPPQYYQKQCQLRSSHNEAQYTSRNFDEQILSKKFPDIKSLKEPNKNHTIPLKLTGAPHYNTLFDIEVLRKPAGYPKQSKYLGEHNEMDQTDQRRSQNNSNYPCNLSTIKKVKWQDGYCATPVTNWYPVKSGFRKMYQRHVPSSLNRSTYNTNSLTYDYEGHNNRYKYRDDYIRYFNATTRDSYNASQKPLPNRCNYYTSTYPGDSRYGNRFNWLYMQENSIFNPYKYHDSFKNMQWNYHSNQKRYRNSDTQYDLVERVHNKKLQVCQSETHKISGIKTKLQSKKVGAEREEIRLTRSDEVSTKHENVGTQIIENKPRSHQTFLMCNSGTQSNESQKLNASTVLSKFLLELTEKIKNSDPSLSVPKQKCVLAEKGTQCITSNTTSPKRTCTKRQLRTHVSKKHIKIKRSNLKIVQNVSTQYEDIKSSEIFTSSTLNTEFEFEREFIRKGRDKDNFCAIESTKKRKGRSSGVCEERIYAKCFVKEIPTLRKTKEQNSVDDSQGSSKSDKSDMQKIQHHERSYINTKQCLPFLIDGRYDKNPYDFKPNFSSSKNNIISQEQYYRKRSASCENRGAKTESKKTNKIDRNASIHSSQSSKSEYFVHEDVFLEKYVVKLCNPKEELFLYDVKPELCDYISCKSVKEKIVQKLKSYVGY